MVVFPYLVRPVDRPREKRGLSVGLGQEILACGPVKHHPMRKLTQICQPNKQIPKVSLNGAYECFFIDITRFSSPSKAQQVTEPWSLGCGVPSANLRHKPALRVLSFQVPGYTINASLPCMPALGSSSAELPILVSIHS